MNRKSLDDVRAGSVTMADFRISAQTLRRQAAVAREHGNPQLAENFERGAEMTALTDDELLGIYELLRPRRATAAELDAVATDLDARHASRAAALVREAAQVYARRGLLKP